MADPTPEASMSWKDIIAKYGAWTVLVFYLLGAIPFAKSPIDKVTDGLKDAIAAHNVDMTNGQKETQSILREILQSLKDQRRDQRFAAPVEAPATATRRRNEEVGR